MRGVFFNIINLLIKQEYAQLMYVSIKNVGIYISFSLNYIRKRHKYNNNVENT